jgi:hypothetical protein
MELDQIANNREAQAEPATRAIDNAPLLREWLEHVREHVWRNPQALVFDR